MSSPRGQGPAGWPAGVALARALGLILLAVLFGAREAEARGVRLRGAEAGGFGRIALEFDQATKVTVRMNGSVLVLGFADKAAIRAERLAEEMPAYVRAARRDPDGAGLRIALVAPVRPNLLEAGEKVFLDLLPPTWAGLPPGLPKEVVDDLARRALEAEARAKEAAQRRALAKVKIVRLRVADLPTLKRLVFDLPKGVPASLAADGEAVHLTFEAPLRLDEGEARGRLAPALRDLAAEPSGEQGPLRVRLALAAGYEASGFREDESFVVDIAARAPAGPAQADAKAAGAPPPAQPTRPDPSPPDRPQAVKERMTPAEGAQPQPASLPGTKAPADAPEPGTGPVRAVAALHPDGLEVVFPFRGRAAAAAFERAGTATLVFHTPQIVEMAALPRGAEGFASLSELGREGAFAVVRLALGGPHLVRLAPHGAQGWRLTIGVQGSGPWEPLGVARATDESGRSALAIPLPDASAVYWTEASRPGRMGERIAVVTSPAPPRGLAKSQRFVEAELLPSAHGVALVAIADDLAVRSGLDGVVVSRAGGLTLSTGEGRPETSAPPPEPVLRREAWADDRRGDVLARIRDKMHAIAGAPRSGRTPLRLELARLLVANGLDAEALGVLAVAASEDAASAPQRGVLLLRGIAAARARRDAQARKALGDDSLGEDPEALLWRAVLDARARRWPQALAGFRQGAPVLDLYPDDLQSGLRVLAGRAALEVNDLGTAEREASAAAASAANPQQRDTAALLRARIDEAAGRTDLAADAYARLADEAERPVAAEATLRRVALAAAAGAMPVEEAVDHLERLSVTWRGDEIEVLTIARLGRLYAGAGRWRDAFAMARRANALYPDHEVTRALHDETARLFEELFLSGKGETLSRIEALALFYDFKEFTPIGRRGDEIVRRLADRLVELDLLGAAGDLLQHQVQQRLTGAARATVAARLATIRLMDGKPLQALSAIQSTRLAELPAETKRARSLLEARALSDLSRTDLAVEVLAGETGPEIDRLRADILWSGRRWREAGETYEGLVGPRWQGADPLSDQDRSDVLRAAIAYGLGDEALALDRLRGRFAAKMADSADARTFSFLTRPNVATTAPFRELARGVTSADTLSDFLKAYRQRYPDAAAAERPAPPAAPRPAGSAPPRG